jgi:hypothetical protein
MSADEEAVMLRPISRGAAVAAAAALVLAVPASATTPAPVQVTGPSPYAGCTAGLDSGGVLYPDSEVEPSVAVNPTNPNNVVGAYQQDRWSDGGSRGNVLSVTFDGGATWRTVTIPGIAACDGGIWPRGTDPWLSFAPNGRLYYVSQSFDDPNFHTAFMVATSSDGGLSWSSPVAVADRYWGAPHNTYDDKVTLTADPTDATGRTAYLTWDRYSDSPSWYVDQNSWKTRFPNNGGWSSVYLSKTTDGGITWSTPTEIYKPGGGNYTTGPLISVLPDRSLVLTVATWFQAKGGSAYTTYAMSRRSKDGGKSWSTVVRGPRMTDSYAADPVTGTPMRTGGGIAEASVDPRNGTVYLVWEDGGATYTAGNSLVSVSTNGGKTWGTPVEVDGSSRVSFTPMVAVTPGGTVGVSFSSFRGNGDEVSQWIATCSASCTTASSWSTQQIGGATSDSGGFPMRAAPYARGLFLGDYSGLAASTEGFHALYGLPDRYFDVTSSDMWYSAVPLGG